MNNDCFGASKHLLLGQWLNVGVGPQLSASNQSIRKYHNVLTLEALHLSNL